ncbi:MAG: glycosyltransferase family 39 protein [Acidobacteria bacterium]|nr:glycosyltransferase family 39 protein [Acidobacteriota bacterium]
MSRQHAGLLLACGLAVHAALAVHTLLGNAATFDEGAHLPAGYTHLALGDHRLNPEQPPLVKLLAAAPLLAVAPKVRTDDLAWRMGRQWEFGRRFLYVWNDADRLLLLARLSVLVLTLLLLSALFLRARRLAGPVAGAATLALAVLSPDLLAHGNLVTTDVGLALFVFLTVAAFDRLTERATWGRLLATGLAAGAALATKFSGLVLAPVLVFLGAVAVWGKGPLESALSGPARAVTGAGRRIRLVLGLLVAIGGLALVVVWASYGFRGALSPDPVVRASLRAPLEAAPEGTWQGALVGAADLGLLPEDYARGLLFVMEHSARRPTFLLGRLSDDGFPDYFLVTFLLKTPIPLLILTLLALVRIPRLPRRTAVFLWAPVAIYIGLTMGRGLQIGHRHLLPILPFLLVAAGEAAASLVRWRRPVGLAFVAVLGAWYGAGTLANHPHHLAYFNEIGGGPTRGWRLLVDSNLDWGQDLKRLKKWMDAHGVTSLKLSYFGSASPSYYGIRGERLPGYSAPHPPRVTREIHPGDIVAVSATNLQGVYLDPEDRSMMERLRRLTPAGRVGRSILVYRADFRWPPGEAEAQITQ